MDNIIINKDKLKELLERAFTNGAISHDKWSGQRDTCWSNVNLDMKEEIEYLVDEITPNSDEN